MDIENPELIFELKNQFKDQYGGLMTGYPNEHYFLIKNFSGEPRFGESGEKRADDQDKPFLEGWIESKQLNEIQNIKNLYPQEAVRKLLDLLSDYK